MGDEIVRFEDVAKRFGSLTILDGLNLSVRRGQKVSLIGPSGSGKTTILRILMTLEKIQGGVVTVLGKPLWHMERQGKLVPADEAHLRMMRRNIGMVFQHFNLFPHLSVLRNVVDPPMISMGVGRDEAEHRARELLGMVGLADKAHHYPSQLSGGQKQRVAIARALAMSPKILLFDEVTSALDPELVEEVQAVLRDIASSTDATMLLVTHEMSFAHSISDRVLFFDRGRIVEQGPPEAIFKNPQEERTKAFLKKILESGRSL